MNDHSTGSSPDRQTEVMKQLGIPDSRPALQLEKESAPLVLRPGQKDRMLNVTGADVTAIRRAAAIIEDLLERGKVEKTAGGVLIQSGQDLLKGKAFDLYCLAESWEEKLGLELKEAEVEWAVDVVKAWSYGGSAMGNGKKKRQRGGRKVTSKIVFETRKGDKVPVGTEGRYVEHVVNGDNKVVWVVFRGFGLAAARTGDPGIAVH